MMTLHEVGDYVTYTVTGFSALYAMLPPWEQFNDYPTFQKGYKFCMIFIVKFGSLNVRSFVNPQIQATSNKAGTDSK